MTGPAKSQTERYGSREQVGASRHLTSEIARVSLVVAALGLAMLLPHLPGRFDASAATVSFLAQLASYAGTLLLVPVGALWVLNRNRSRLWLELTLGLAGVIVLVLMIAAIAVNHAALGVIIAAALALSQLKARRSQDGPDRAARLPVYLIVIPIVLVTFRTIALPRAAEWSRNRAIQHSASLIREIESFRERIGHYPLSLHSLHQDVPTGVVGVERFMYEPHGDSYNLFFVRPAVDLDAQEVVIFNPRDEQRFTAHELDLLQYQGGQLDLRRGDQRRNPLAQPHWVSILFD